MLHFFMNIILFDGECNLCNFSVQFIVKRDAKGYFHFTSQSSKMGKKLMEKHQLEEIDSLILVSKGEVYLYSDAIIEIAKHLDGWYHFLAFFRFLPKRFRDRVYRFIANYRYRIFGRKSSCLMPNREILKRFM